MGFTPRAIRHMRRNWLLSSSGVISMWVLCLEGASWGTHTLGTFQKYPLFRPLSTTSDIISTGQHIPCKRHVGMQRAIVGTSRLSRICTHTLLQPNWQIEAHAHTNTHTHIVTPFPPRNFPSYNKYTHAPCCVLSGGRPSAQSSACSAPTTAWHCRACVTPRHSPPYAWLHRTFRERSWDGWLQIRDVILHAYIVHFPALQLQRDHGAKGDVREHCV